MDTEESVREALELIQANDPGAAQNILADLAARLKHEKVRAATKRVAEAFAETNQRLKDM